MGEGPLSWRSDSIDGPPQKASLHGAVANLDLYEPLKSSAGAV